MGGGRGEATWHGQDLYRRWFKGRKVLSEVKASQLFSIQDLINKMLITYGGDVPLHSINNLMTRLSGAVLATMALMNVHRKGKLI